MIQLSAIEARIMGCLMEKEVTTPDYYPLTMNALVTACNQKSNRDPVMSLDDSTVEEALNTLRYDKHLVSQVDMAGSRTRKYRHSIESTIDLSREESAILCELLLRGPQTAGELRTRVARLGAPIADHAMVEEILRGMTEFEAGPFVVHLPREAGRRERRYAHLLCGEVQIDEMPEASPREPGTQTTTRNERIDALESGLSELRDAVAALTRQFDEFKRQFE